ncbi:DapH/DapD/GlmU-related protein [Polycladidibacter stylochi]|uniref:DapH/DapD/GlmU-related protein n=1 Tax=Polycladidibacter stylochi TaxID=1807766 RepID=UPI00082CBA05|nr:DapH/DapD/GlmU-related protein [Pseudovibrio stylochi]
MQSHSLPRLPKIAETVIDESVSQREVTVGRFCELLGPSTIEYSEIGDYSYFGPGCMIHDTTIGKFTAIAANVRVCPPNHPMERASQHRFTYTPEYYLANKQRDSDFFAKRRANRVSIGNDVWIGHAVTVLPGVTIGDGAVIAAGAVVTKDVEPYTIVAGVPAKPVRLRFPKSLIPRLQELQWWNWPKATLFEALDLFQKPLCEQLLRQLEQLKICHRNDTHSK